MHAKFGLRVLLKWKICRPDSVVTSFITLTLMRYRISTLFAALTVFAIALSVTLVMRQPPHHVQLVIDHLKNLPQPCTAEQFDGHMPKCKYVVKSSWDWSDESLSLWKIRKPGQHYGESGYGAVGSTLYGMQTEYTKPDPLGQTFVSKVAVTKTVVKSMYDTGDVIWSWSAR